MKPIGGYFGLEHWSTPLYYPDGIYINSCRNGIRYLIRSLGIKKIHIPVFTCHVVEEVIISEGCEISKYNINEELFPIQEIPLNEFIIYNNYFGISGEKVRQMASIFPNLVVDNAQAFFAPTYGRAAVYSPRKFFGLPDGGILRSENIPIIKLENSTSWRLCTHLLKRIDMGAEAGYKDFIKDDEALDSYHLAEMSRLTKVLMGNIDYENARERRLRNFNFLKSSLLSDFPLEITKEDVPLVFPYLIENGNRVRKKLIENKIFCAQYWPNVLEDTRSSHFEKNLAQNIVSIPIDQRYNIEEMKKIIELIKL